MKDMVMMQRAERGAALVMALLILVIVSLLGISAMKSSVFSAKVATGTQADAMAFEAAETALSEIYTELNAMTGEALYASLGAGEVLYRCVSEDDVVKAGECAESDRLDSRGLLVAESATKLNGYEPIPGAEIGMTAGSPVMVDYKVAMLGESEMESFNLSDHHLQEALKMGVKPGSEIE